MKFTFSQTVSSSSLLESQYIKINVTNNYVFSLQKLYLDIARE